MLPTGFVYNLSNSKSGVVSFHFPVKSIKECKEWLTEVEEKQQINLRKMFLEKAKDPSKVLFKVIQLLYFIQRRFRLLPSTICAIEFLFSNQNAVCLAITLKHDSTNSCQKNE